MFLTPWFIDSMMNVEGLKFNNYTLDQKPVAWKKTDNGYKAVCRTVGVDADDIEIKLVADGISVYGETKYDEDNVCNVEYLIPIDKSIINSIKEIQYTTKNGLTYIYLTLNDNGRSNIPIVKI